MSRRGLLGITNADKPVAAAGAVRAYSTHDVNADVAGQMIERNIGMTRYLKKTEDALKIATDPAAVFPKYAKAVEDMRADVGKQVKEDVENFIKLGYSVDKAEEMARLGVEHFVNYKLSQVNAEFPGVGDENFLLSAAAGVPIHRKQTKAATIAGKRRKKITPNNLTEKNYPAVSIYHSKNEIIRC